jgi:hypothetical protein
MLPQIMALDWDDDGRVEWYENTQRRRLGENILSYWRPRVLEADDNLALSVYLDYCSSCK